MCCWMDRSMCRVKPVSRAGIHTLQILGIVCSIHAACRPSCRALRVRRCRPMLATACFHMACPCQLSQEQGLQPTLT